MKKIPRSASRVSRSDSDTPDPTCIIGLFLQWEEGKSRGEKKAGGGKEEEECMLACMRACVHVCVCVLVCWGYKYFP